jgi:GNAT superfamily N-acetyltransferase
MAHESSRPAPPRVRDARPADRDTIVAFNQGLALETESKRLDAGVLSRGVEAALADPDRLRYWVAESPEGRIIGQAAISREWSDWRCGWLWWLQSVYVDANWRGRGVFAAIFRHIRAEAKSRSDVIGLRLYVENENTAAQAIYRALGLAPGGYHVYEDLWGLANDRSS